ncbi:MAG: DUF1501 domain-containing protein [Betaproteobacteria bacterium]|nr:DUF1501 domain-containing protein [Betaproteobacteria bacterium]
MNNVLNHLKLSRRQIMFHSGAIGLASFCHVSLAAAPDDRKFVLVILRGAMDGLAVVAPYGDPAYRAARGRLAFDPPGSGDAALLPMLDGFGLNPRLPFLHELWRKRELAFMHACATPYRDRSHFDGQDVLESGANRVFAANDGWLNRALSARPHQVAERGGIAIAATVPLVLRGAAPSSSWAPSSAPSAAQDTLARLMDLYAGDDLLAPALARAIHNQQTVAESPMAMAAGERANNGVQVRMAEAAARLLVAPQGPAAAVLSFDGWDTHANQGTVQGAMALRLSALDNSLRALQAGLGAHWAKSVVVVATEFGRTVAENGTGGTDHGTGSLALVMGGAVRGARMLGDWPTLARSALYEGRDLAPVNDLRGLLLAVLSEHWGIETERLRREVFPGLEKKLSLPTVLV